MAWEQLSLFPGLFGGNRKRRRVTMSSRGRRETFVTGDYRTHSQPPLAVVYQGARHAHYKVDRARRKAG